MKIEKAYIDKLEFTEKEDFNDSNSLFEQKIITGGMTIKNMGIHGEDNMEKLMNLGIPVGLITSNNYNIGINEHYEPEFDGGNNSESYRENNNFSEKKTASLELNDGLLKLIQLYKSNKNKKTKKLHKYSAPSNKNISKHK